MTGLFDFHRFSRTFLFFHLERPAVRGPDALSSSLSLRAEGRPEWDLHGHRRGQLRPRSCLSAMSSRPNGGICERSGRFSARGGSASGGKRCGMTDSHGYISVKIRYPALFFILTWGDPTSRRVRLLGEVGAL